MLAGRYGAFKMVISGRSCTSNCRINVSQGEMMKTVEDKMRTASAGKTLIRGGLYFKVVSPRFLYNIDAAIPVVVKDTASSIANGFRIEHSTGASLSISSHPSYEICNTFER
jgi:hypothetical protein